MFSFFKKSNNYPGKLGAVQHILFGQESLRAYSGFSDKLEEFKCLYTHRYILLQQKDTD